MNYFRKHRNQLSSLSDLIFKYIEISTVLGILIAILAYADLNKIYEHIFLGILIFASVTKIFVDIDKFFIEKLEKNGKNSLVLQTVITVLVFSILYYFVFSLSNIITDFELNLFTQF